jgi:hypothetical protein
MIITKPWNLATSDRKPHIDVNGCEKMFYCLNVADELGYTFSDDGWPARTTWARGAWKENSYDLSVRGLSPASFQRWAGASWYLNASGVIGFPIKEE